jgi:nitrous oxidase accessory protein NosD
VSTNEASPYVSHIGAKIVESLPNQVDRLPILSTLDYAGDFYFNSSAPLTSRNWTLQQYNFTPNKCNLQGLIIGKFVGFPLSPSVLSPPFNFECGGNYAYHYIDDVSITGIEPNMDLPDTLAFCTGNSVTLSFDSINYFTEYGWYRNGVPIPGATSRNYTATTTGRYYAYGYNPICPDVYWTDTCTIIVAPPLQGNNIEVPYTKCDSTSNFRVLDTVIGSTYTWRGTHATPAVFTGTRYNPIWTNYNTVDTIRLTITNAYGCKRDTSFIVWYCCAQQAYALTNQTVDTINTLLRLADPLALLDNFNYGCHIIDGFFRINRNCTFKNFVFSMSPNSKIIIDVGKQVIFDSCTFVSCDTVMWQGIFIKGSTSKITMKNSIVEHAMVGIDNTAAGMLDLYRDTFNYNYRDIWMHSATINPSFKVEGSAFVNITHKPEWDCIARYSANPDRLYQPVVNKKSFIGIQVDSIFNITIGDGAMGKLQNYFNKHNYGIYSKYSSIYVYNNRMDTLYTLASEPNNAGMGIYNYGRNPINTFKTIVGKSTGNFRNIFNSTNFAIFTRHTTDTIVNNYIKGCNTGIYADSAISVLGTSRSIVALFDTIINYNVVGIDVEHSKSASIQIKNNYLKTTGPVYIPLFFSTQPKGIFVNQLRYLALSPTTVDSTASNTLVVQDNKVIGGKYGIYLINNRNSNVLGNEVRSEKNALSFVGGIRLDNVHNSNIKCNAVIGNARDSVAPFKPIIAMHVQDSRRNFIDCNHTDSAHYGIRFFSNCYTLNGIAGNEFANSYDQFVLMTNGFIGNQFTRATSGGIFQNLDNQWLGWSVRNTYTINSYGNLSTLFTRTSTLPFRPMVNSRNFAIFTIISPVTYPIATFTGCPTSCSGILFRTAGGEEGSKSEKIEFLEEAAAESIPAEISEEENTYLLKKDAYLELKKDTTLLDSSEILDIFYAEMKASNIELMDKIQHLMEQENIEEAKLQNQTFVTTNKIEENEKMMNEILLNADNIDINEVWQVVMDIANQCPISGGEAVYDARAWLMTYDKNLDWLDDDRCIKGIDYRIANPNPTTEEIKVLLFPNPSNEYINIWMKDYMISDEETIYIEIRDMLGRTILNTSDKMQSSIMKLETSKWASGNYILKISTSKGFETKTKINVLH